MGDRGNFFRHSIAQKLGNTGFSAHMVYPVPKIAMHPKANKFAFF